LSLAVLADHVLVRTVSISLELVKRELTRACPRRNEYFRLLEEEKWQERKWKGPPQFENKSDKSLMMVCSRHPSHRFGPRG
jgi:hypothetical protein